MMYVLYALKLNLRLKRNQFVVFFIAQVSHTPESQTQIAPRAKWGLEENRAALWRWPNKGGTWALL